MANLKEIRKKYPNKIKIDKLSWLEIWKYALDIVGLIKEEKNFKPQHIYGVSRGGIIPAAMIAKQLKLPMSIIDPDIISHKLFIYNSLIVDDIFDSGDTLYKIMESLGINPKDLYRPKVATLIESIHTNLTEGNRYKNSLILSLPDFCSIGCKDDTWFEFPWEGEND